MGLPSLNPSACLNKPVQIYVLIDPRYRTAFYIGATTRKPYYRLGSHINDACHLKMAGKRCDVIRSIVSSGFRPELFVLETAKNTDWPEAEQFWIAYFRFIGADLTNIGIGGPGALGAKQSASAKLKRQQAAAGRDLSALRSKEVRERAASKMRTMIEVSGVSYPGIAVASRETGIPTATLNYWLDTGKAKRLTGRRVGYKRPLGPGKCHGADHPNSLGLVVDGVTYVSRAEAAAALGVDKTTIHRMLRDGRAISAGTK